MSQTALRTWPGYGPPLVAALVTFLLAGFAEWLGRAGSAPAETSSLLLILYLPVPIIVPVLWAMAQLMGLPRRLVFWGAAGWLVLGLSQYSADVMVQFAGQTATGILAGMALQMRWRLDVALVVAAAALVPSLVMTTLEVSIPEQFQLMSDQVLEVYQESMPEGADQKQQALALEEQRRQVEKVVAVGMRIYPTTMTVGVLGHAGFVLALVWLLARPMGLNVGLAGLRPLQQWRFPFYVVWMLVVGIGLFLTRLPGPLDVGLTLMMLSALLLSLQGFSIQVFLTARTMSGPGRVTFWLIMSVFFGFVLLISGLLLGLADQWIDLRRHFAAAGSDDSGTSG